MPHYFFIWDPDRIEHIAYNGVTPDEFEQVVCNRYETDTSRTSGRPIAIGITVEGRKLVCVYELIDDDTVYPVTAFEPEAE